MMFSYDENIQSGKLQFMKKPFKTNTHKKAEQWSLVEKTFKSTKHSLVILLAIIEAF